MRKLYIVLLILATLIGLSFLVIRYFANSSAQDNWFNNNWREKFARSTILRTVFNLRWDGDAKTDYLLNNTYTNILIEVDRQEDCSINPEVWDGVISEMKCVTKKTGEITVEESDTIPLARESYTSEQTRGMANRYRNNKTKGDTALLHIVCLNTYAEAPSNIGLTVYENGIVLFWNALKRVAGSNTIALNKFISSTILHEFGHQLGVDHIEAPFCLMNAEVESPPLDRPVYIQTTYCDEEIAAIEEIKKRFQN